MLEPDVWGCGYATESGAACLPVLFEARLRAGRVDRAARQTRSIAVQQRLGFEPWREVLWSETGILLEVRSLTGAAWRSACQA